MSFNMGNLSKEQAVQLATITSSVYMQGGAWVLKKWDLKTGTERLVRNLTEKNAKNKLKKWRKERVEQLLRENGESTAYVIRTWHEQPTWDCKGMWQWVQKNWYISKEEAEKALSEKTISLNKKFDIFQTKVKEIPGHFNVA